MTKLLRSIEVLKEEDNKLLVYLRIWDGANITSTVDYALGVDLSNPPGAKTELEWINVLLESAAESINTYLGLIPAEHMSFEEALKDYK